MARGGLWLGRLCRSEACSRSARAGHVDAVPAGPDGADGRFVFRDLRGAASHHATKRDTRRSFGRRRPLGRQRITLGAVALRRRRGADVRTDRCRHRAGRIGEALAASRARVSGVVVSGRRTFVAAGTARPTNVASTVRRYYAGEYLVAVATRQWRFRSLCRRQGLALTRATAPAAGSAGSRVIWSPTSSRAWSRESHPRRLPATVRPLPATFNPSGRSFDEPHGGGRWARTGPRSISSCSRCRR